MDQYQLVYKHKDPRTDEVFYIGSGTLDRPWDLHKARKQDHKNHLIDICSSGYTMADVTELVLITEDKNNAKEVERVLIQDHKPAQNKLSNPEHHKAVKENSYDMGGIREMHKQGASYSAIGKAHNIAAMTAWRLINE